MDSFNLALKKNTHRETPVLIPRVIFLSQGSSLWLYELLTPQTLVSQLAQRCFSVCSIPANMKAKKSLKKDKAEKKKH
jgi:hypothetical protein